MARIKRDDQTLAQALVFFDQELVSVRMTAEAYQKIRNKNMPSIVSNSLVTSFALHHRAVLDFLTLGPEKAKPSDIIAEDFFDSPDDWGKVAIPLSERMLNNRKRANKTVAHLTYDKIGPTKEERLWHFDQMLDDLAPGVLAFYSHIPEKFIGENFDLELKHPIWNRRIKINRVVKRKPSLLPWDFLKSKFFGHDLKGSFWNPRG